MGEPRMLTGLQEGDLMGNVHLERKTGNLGKRF
jgi:hypothetical protein